MKMNTLFAALIAAPVLGLGGSALAETPNKDTRDTSMKDAQGQYKTDKQACDSLSGNARDMCVAEAKGRESITRAKAEVEFENTAKNREKVRVATADAAWSVAKERCDDSAGTTKDVCLKEAKAVHVKALSDAKVDRVTSEAKKDVDEKTTEIREDGAEKTADAHQEAADEQREADYKLAAEKCEGLAGAAKDGCVRDARARYTNR